MTYTIYFLFFVLGATFTKAFSFFLNMGYSVLILKGAELTALKMIVGLTEDIAFMRELKYATLIKAGATDDALINIKIMDDHTLKNWKEGVIKKIIQAYPHSYRSQVPYNDWSGALKHLDKVSKKKRT